MTVMVKMEGARFIVRDVLRRPLVELELGDSLAVLRRLSATVVQVRSLFTARTFRSIGRAAAAVEHKRSSSACCGGVC